LPAVAQRAASDAGADAGDLRLDALMALPDKKPVPQDNVIATAPGLEQQTPAPRLSANLTAPIYFIQILWKSDLRLRAMRPHAIVPETKT